VLAARTPLYARNDDGCRAGRPLRECPEVLTRMVPPKVAAGPEMNIRRWVIEKSRLAGPGHETRQSRRGAAVTSAAGVQGCLPFSGRLGTASRALDSGIGRLRQLGPCESDVALVSVLGRCCHGSSIHGIADGHRSVRAAKHRKGRLPAPEEQWDPRAYATGELGIHEDELGADPRRRRIVEGVRRRRHPQVDRQARPRPDPSNG
jgi:hypothetical protein